VKFRFGLLLWLLATPLTAFGHTEIFFPKVFSTAELPNTGFVLLNPDPDIATVNIYLISMTGTKVAETVVTIPRGGQLARLGSELFPNASVGGWVYLINDTEGMQAFFLNYDSGITSLDGAEAASYDTIGSDQVIPLIAESTELNVVNTSAARLQLTIRLFGVDGQIGTTVNRDVAVAGAFQSDVATLFPSVNMAQARYVRIQTGSAFSLIISCAVIRGFTVPRDTALINGINVTQKTDLTFNHVVSGQLPNANYTTIIGVTNLSSQAQSVHFAFHAEDGSVLEVSRNISANGALREAAQSIFTLASTFQTGWVSIESATSIAGFAGYADTVAGGFAVVPAGTPQTKMFFSHIANGPPQWQTGLALLNATATSAAIEIFAVNPNGSQIGSTSLTLEAGTKLARTIQELIPQTQGVNGGFIYVQAQNDVPLTGIELFYTRDLKVLSNVAAAKLVPGVKYVPPPM
jgi:hypothetical protein